MNVSATRTIDNTLTPVVSKPRIQALDVIRGMSILGILAVNADGYAAPIAASLKPATWPYPNVGSTAIAYWVMDAFFHDKFVTLFSMLFGAPCFWSAASGVTSRKAEFSGDDWQRCSSLPCCTASAFGGATSFRCMHFPDLSWRFAAPGDLRCCCSLA